VAEITNEDGAFFFPLVFDDGETDVTMALKLIDTDASDLDTTFNCVLTEDPDFKKTEGATFTDPMVTRSARSINCIIKDNGTNNARIKALAQTVNRLENAFSAATRSSYAQQFRDAVELHPDIDANGEEIPLACMDYVLHLLSLFWKILFAVVPPSHMCGGWLSFVVSLMLIGALTACVGEFASLFGCSMGLEDEVTAITFVALGTSLPDTFASAQAASQSEYADSAIGNITGSNAVNVFFGLGLPWIIACFYHLGNPNADGSKSYYFPAGSLAFSVIVFLICALCCFSVLILKRVFDYGELGGTSFLSRSGSAAFFVLLWFIYVLLSSLLCYKHFANPF
jgi:solute carrier family 8 (sodium/calcium exchanger)